MGGMSMTAEQAAQARAAAQQNAAQGSGNPVNWNGNAPVAGPPGGAVPGMPVDPHQTAKDKQKRPVGMGGGDLATQPLWPGGPSWPGGGGQQAPQPPPYFSMQPFQGPGTPMQSTPQVPQVPYFSMSGGINPGAAANPMGQADANGVTYHQNPIATWMTTQMAKNAGITTYDQAKAYTDALAQGGGPGGPPGPQGGGGGGRGGGGGGGRNAGDVTGETSGSAPTDTASQIALLASQQGGRRFKMDQNIRNILGSLGRSEQFVGLLQSLGFQPLGVINQDGFYNDWIVPQNLQMTPEYQQMLASLDPVDSMALQMMVSQLFGPVGAAGETPGTTPQVPTTPQIPGFGGNKNDLIQMMPEPNPQIPGIPGMPTNPIQLPIQGRK